MTARYALYHAPAADTLLWQRASQWLGRDAVSGEDVVQPRFAALADLDFASLTADPRLYGFHATLKAPFALAQGMTEAGLIAAAADFARPRAAFSATIQPRALGPFLAFQIEGDSPAMAALAADCVRDFEPFRAPLIDADLARRRRAPLTPRQDAQLAEWGYPYVFEDFRFHMTLTGAIADAAMRVRVLAAAEDYFAEISPEQMFDSISLFRQPDRASPFTILERFVFGA
jgi:putative phosphonate metabolism protein